MPMSMDRMNDARAFLEFLDAKLLESPEVPPLDELLALWEVENRSEEEREETSRAIQRGLDDIAAGRVKPALEAINEVRREHNLPDLT